MQLRFGFSDEQIDEMPLTRLAGRLVREEKRREDEEKKRRHELWVNFAALFFANRGESEAPMTKQEFQDKRAVEEGKKKPTTPTEEEWRGQAEARKSWEKLRTDYYMAAQSPYHFEETMMFGDHVFSKPPEPERKILTAREIKEQEQVSQRQFIAGLKEQVAGTRKG